MAGEKLDERFGEGFTDRVKPDGLQDPTKQGGYSKKELLAEFRLRDKGVKVDEGDNSLVNKYQGLVDSGEKFNGQAQSYLESHGVTFGGGGDKPSSPPETTPVDPEDPGPPIELDPIEGPNPVTPPISVFPTPGSNTQTQIVNQDNDQISTVNGDGNTVTQNQDNSVSQSGYNAGQSAKKAMGLKDKYVLNLLGA